MWTYILFIIGFIFLIKGADLLVDGASSIAKRLGISDIVIGLTIVSLGTSAPELLVNIVASFQGNADIGIGNILGSNISNILLILGIAALIHPLKIRRNTTWKEVPLNLLAVIVLFIIANDVFFDKAGQSVLSRTDGLVLIGFFFIFLNYTISLAKVHREVGEDVKHQPIAKAVIMTILGAAGLAFGGQWVVDGAIAIARQFGLSETFIGLTIVAVGTSLPELATSAMAAFKKRADIAIGNVVGSNLFNIFWVLGLSAAIKPLPFNPMVNTDIGVCLFATILLFVFCFTKKKYQLDRLEGGLFLAAYVAYIVFLIIRG